MGARKGRFWTVLGGAFCATIRKVLVGRDLRRTVIVGLGGIDWVWGVGLLAKLLLGKELGGVGRDSRIRQMNGLVRREAKFLGRNRPRGWTQQTANEHS